MNPNVSSRRTQAFTLVELLTVIAIIGILAALLMPVLNKAEQRAKRIVCIDDLGQIGLAFHTYSGDHNGKFPMAVSTNDGGSLEYVESGFASGDVFYTTFRNFQPLSGQLVLPQLLICPTDRRAAATNFASLQNENLSYFVGVEGTFDKPTSILAGDRNLTTNAFEQPTILGFGQDSNLGWTWEMHQFKGNLVFADGHVEQWNNASLATGESTSPFIQSLFMPSVVADASLPYAAGSSGSGGSGSPGSSGSSDASGSGPGSSDSGSASFTPNASSSGPAGPSASNSGSGATTASGSSQNDQSSAAQPAQPMPGYSSGQQLSKAEAADEASPSGSIVTNRPVIQASDPATNVAVAVQDPDADMAPFDRHMTMVLRIDLLWLYLLLCLLVLLYLLYRMHKRKRERQARLARLAKQNSDWVEDEP